MFYFELNIIYFLANCRILVISRVTELCGWEFSMQVISFLFFLYIAVHNDGWKNSGTTKFPRTIEMKSVNFSKDQEEFTKV